MIIVFTGLREMSAVQTRSKANILILPEDLLSNISSWLDDRAICMMEVASKRFHKALSNSCGPPRTRLKLGAPSEFRGEDESSAD